MFNPNAEILNDKAFLKQLDEYPIHETMAKIIVTDFDEKPLGDITGKIETGSISVDGSSSCRRTCQLTLFTTDPNVNELDWQIHTKYIVTIGKKNFVNSSYPEWIWFPMGMYILTDMSLTNRMNGFSISLTGKDKTCLIDGTVGGALFAEHDFAHIDVINEGDITTTEDCLIYDIIREAVHVYAKEPYENIIINDLEDVSVELLDFRIDNYYGYIYNVSNTQDFISYSSGLCLIGEDGYTNEFQEWLDNHYQDGDEGITINQSYNGHWYRIVKKLEYGETAGYRQTDLIFPGELVVKAGGTIVEMLNKIIEVLGEFEFFYDVYGRFIFRRKQIYHNVVWTGTEALNENYGNFSITEAAQDIYDFTNSNIIESFANKPKMTNIRNDWAIWGAIGETNDSSHKKWACHLRYAIDDKPKVYHCLSDGYWYMTQEFYEAYSEDTDKKDANIQQELAIQELEDLLIEYKEYVESFKQRNGSAFSTASQIKGYVAQMRSNLQRRFKIVDYRELLYRMALDYQQAQTRIRELEAVSSKSCAALYNVHCFDHPSSLYHGDESYFNNTNDIPVTWYYDLESNTFKQFPETQLDLVNNGKLEKNGDIKIEGRVHRGQTPYTWTEWVLRQNNLKWIATADELNNSSRTYVDFIHADTDSSIETYVMDGIQADWQVRGMMFQGWDSRTSSGVTYYVPIVRVTAAKTFEIIAKELLAWEARINNNYAIYFTDMLSFWPLYYKTVNDLTKDDAPAALSAGLDYSSQMLVQIQSSTFSTAQSAYKTGMEFVNRSTSMSPDEKSQKRNAYKANYLEKLNTVEEQTIQYQTDIANKRAEVRGKSYANFFNSTCVDGVINLILTYITEQKANVNAGYTAVAATQERYERYVSDLKHQIDTFDAEQQQHHKDIVRISYQAWVDNGYWNPDVIKYHSETNTITFIAPEDMLFWIDFMDTYSELGKYKIGSIGHRAQVVNDDKVKAIFYRDVPNILWLQPGEALDALSNLSYVRLRLNNGLSNYFKISKQGKSAKDELDELIYESTYYQETVTLSCIPIYWFEPNQRIRIVDNNTGIRGEYIIKNFTYQLKFDGMMSLTAYKAADRLI